MPLDPASMLNDFNPAAACKAADALKGLASQAPAGLLDQLGGGDFLKGMPSNLVSQLGPLLDKASPAEMLKLANLAGGALTDPAQLEKLKNALPADALAALAGPAGDAAKALQNELPAFLAEQLPQVPELANMAGLPGMPALPNVPGLPSIPGMPAMPGMPQLPGIPPIPGVPPIPGAPDMNALMSDLQNKAASGMPFDPADAANLVNGLKGEAANAYQDALNEIPPIPDPRAIPEDIPLPDPADLTESAASCLPSDIASPEQLLDEAMTELPPLPDEITEAVGAPEQFASDFVGAMGEVMNQLDACPDIMQEAAGMMSLLGGGPVNDIAKGLQGMAEAYAGAAAKEGAKSAAEVAKAAEALQGAAQQMPADALSGLL